MTGKLTCFAAAAAGFNRRLIFIQSLLYVVTVLFDNFSSDVTWRLDVPISSNSALIETQPSNSRFTQVDNYTNYTQTL